LLKRVSAAVTDGASGEAGRPEASVVSMTVVSMTVVSAAVVSVTAVSAAVVSGGALRAGAIGAKQSSTSTRSQRPAHQYAPAPRHLGCARGGVIRIQVLKGKTCSAQNTCLISEGFLHDLDTVLERGRHVVGNGIAGGLKNKMAGG